MTLTFTDPREISVHMVSDGTTTVAEVIQHARDRDVQLGIGTAKRRKGDRRDAELGQLIASIRAFEDAADKLRRAAKKMGYDI